jgi:phosphoribosyl 1,2-cyclic phosphate phosphodiesterase
MSTPLLTITLLGTGASAGVPLIGCSCSTCISDNTKNKRMRVSILIQSKKTTLLVDASPDLRQQALRFGINHIDAVFFTHAHADHTHGIDDLRSFNYLSNKPLPCYLDQETRDQLIRRFDYAFLPPHASWSRPALTPHIITANQPIMIGDLCVLPIAQQHGKQQTMGLRIGNFAYSPDVNFFSEESFNQLYHLDYWVVDCLRETPSPTHAHFAQTLTWIDVLKPKHAILTHMSHELCYETLENTLPPHIRPGYDGLPIQIYMSKMPSSD